MSKRGLNVPSSFNVREEDRLNCFSYEKEYLQYVDDFYNRPWSSVLPQITAEQQKKEIDLAYAEYFASKPKDDIDNGVSSFDNTSFDIDFFNEEEISVKDRSQRVSRLLRSRQAKRHAKDVKDIIDKKAKQRKSEEYEIRHPSKTTFKRERVVLEVFDYNLEDHKDAPEHEFETSKYFSETSEDAFVAKVLSHKVRSTKSFIAKHKQAYKLCNHIREVNADVFVVNDSIEITDFELVTIPDKKPHQPYVNATAMVSEKVNSRYAKKRLCFEEHQ